MPDPAPREPPGGELSSWWQQRRRAAKVGLLVGGVLVALAVLGAVLSDDEAPRAERDRGALATTTEPAAGPEPERETEPEPEPESTGRLSEDEWALFSRAHAAFLAESQGLRDGVDGCQAAGDLAGFWACVEDVYSELGEAADRAIRVAANTLERVGWECRDALGAYITSAREYRAALVDTLDVARLFSFDGFAKALGRLTPAAKAWGDAAAVLSSQCWPE